MTELMMNSNNRTQVCTFWLNDCLFGINILDVKEVNSELDFTPIYHSSEKVCGYVNIRGNIYLVLNMRIMMGYDSQEYTDECRVVLFKSNVGESFGVLVDKVGDVVEVDEDKIENRRIGDGINELNDRRADREFGMGVYKLEDRLIVILNARKLLIDA